MAQSGRTIRVYVSSTYHDMHAERDYLHKIVFPALRERIAARNLNLVVVDQRCDVSEDKADIELAFKEIEQSTFFIGIMGDRYGFIPDKIPENALIQYPWLRNYSGLSVTALEILHALHTPNLSNHSFFYFRNPQIVSEVPEVVRSDYVAKDREEALKLKELKDKIRASGRPTNENYPCQWDDQKTCLVGLKTFGESVLNDLWQAIDKLYRNIEVENISIVHNIEFGVQEKPSKQPLYLDKNVQFTVYCPKKIQPIKWYPLLTFAHLSERPPDAKEDEPDPIEEVQKQAKQILGGQVGNYADLTDDSRQAVPRQGEITLVPEVPGIEFNPPSWSFLWTEAVHKEEFRIRASQQLDGKMAKGRISVFLSGIIILAEIDLRIKVDSHEQHKTPSIPYEHINSRTYQRIFASYSRKDFEIVKVFEMVNLAQGNEYLRDLVHIRTGEVWDERLIQMIYQADSFQLFWSWNSMRSKFVEREWRYALSLKRSQFVLPVYWEDPRPELKEENLPPEELDALHFYRLPIENTSINHKQERSEKLVKQGKKIAKTIPGTSKTTNPSRKKTLRNSMFICLPIVFISGLVIGIYQYMDFSVRKANTTIEEINGIASKNEPQQLLQNRLENLLCQKGIVPEEIESAKQIEEEALGGNINIANKEDIISGGDKLSDNTIAEIIRKDFGLPIHTNLIDSDKIQEQVPINETISQDIPNEEPEVKGGQLTFVACMRDGAELRDKPESNAQVIKTIPWMTDFVVIKRYTDLQKREWMRVGDLNTMKEAIPHGWMLKDDLLMRMEAMKEEGIYKKAIVVTYYNKATKELGGAPLRYAPLLGAPRVGHELTLYNFFHIYDMCEDDEGKETFCLIGNEAAVSDYTKPENTILGWVPMSKLFMWNTRVAAEYDKSTLDKRGPVRIYESLEDLKAVVEGRKSPEQVRVLATEDISKKEMLPEDFRFPIIDDEIEINGLKVWKIGFAGAVTSPVNVATINDLAKSGTLLSKRVLDLLEQNGIDVNKVMNEEKKQTMAAFGEGFVASTEPGTGIRMMKPVAHVNREEVEALITLLGQVVQMPGNDSEYAKKILRETLELVTNDPIDDKTVSADIIRKQMGIPVKSEILQVPLTDLYKYPDKQREAIRELEKKLFLLRGVANEKEVTVKEDEHGNITYELGKDKQWFTGTRGNEWVWLDMKHLP